MRLLAGVVNDDRTVNYLHLQRRDNGGLRDVDLAETAHPLFAFFAFSG